MRDLSKDKKPKKDQENVETGDVFSKEQRKFLADNKEETEKMADKYAQELVANLNRNVSKDSKKLRN